MPVARLQWLILFLLTLPALAGAQSTLECPLPPASTQCAPAAQLGEQAEPAPDLGLLNPVDLLSGQKYQSDTDLPLSEAWPLLQLQRHWNGQGHNPTPSLGRTGWAMSYDLQLRQQGHALFMPDGRQTRLYPPAQASDSGWSWQGPNGLVLRFDKQGWLGQVRISPQQWLQIERLPAHHPHAYAVQTVRNHLGQTLELDWDSDPNKIRIRTPAGPFELHVEQDDQGLWLARVSRPDGMLRHYHRAQAPWTKRMGGSSLQAPGQPAQLVQEWEYDEQGRVSRLHSQAFNQEWNAAYAPDLSEWSIGQERHRFLYGNYQGLARLHSLESRMCTGCPAYRTEWNYDAQGRWLQAGPWRAERRTNGSLSLLNQKQGGWGALTLNLDAEGRLQRWSSDQFGAESRHWTTAGQLQQIDYARDGKLLIVRDKQGRLSRVRHHRHGENEVIELDWLGPTTLRIRHPKEIQWLKLRAGLLQERRLERSHSPGQQWTERFEYDGQQRLTHYSLPEGGHIRYQWDGNGRLQSLEWINPEGRSHTVIQAQEYGYRWGNGLQLISRANSAGQTLDQMVLSPNGEPVWTQSRRLDEQGKVLEEQHDYLALGQNRHWLLHYDSKQRLAAFRQGEAGPVNWLYWDDNGALRSRHPHDIAPIQRSPTGLAESVGKLNLDYGPNRRLRRVQAANQVLLEYQHDAFGQRIWRQQGAQERAFFFHGQQLMAELDLPALPGQLVSRRYLYAGLTPVAMIVYGQHQQGQLYYLHSDLMAAVRLISDQEGQAVWAADLNPLGQAELLKEWVEFNLRLPGQYEESATGWHDNLLRSYLPSHGQYLEADPLGPWPGTQALGYARQQPTRHIDPTGLLLFAFDGTRQAPITKSNVWKLSQLYQDGAVHYSEGPGNPLSTDWDALTAWRAGRILESQWNHFLNRLQEQGPAPTAVPIDLLGFSRGAALARDFSNRILDYTNQGWFVLNDPQRGAIRACITPRFLGLFDTVAQFGLGGWSNKQYRLGASEAWNWVAHAVAMHEHRLHFPLSGLAQAMNTVEMPFIGAHSQIGGGVLPDENTEASDLDKVALAWMHWQAKAAGLKLAELPQTDLSVMHPVLLDMRPAGMRLTKHGVRRVDYHGQGKDLLYQDSHPALGKETREALENLITRFDNWRTRSDSQAAWVDMDAYDAWLQNHLGWER